MPYVNVRIANDGATIEQKRQVIAGITDVLVKVLNKKPEATFVVIDEVDLDNWGHKGTTLRELRAAAAAAAAPVARKPAGRQPAVKKPAAKKPAAGKPAVKKAAAKRA